MAKHFAFVALVLYLFCQGTVARFPQRTFTRPHADNEGRHAGYEPGEDPRLDKRLAFSLHRAKIIPFDGKLAKPLIANTKDIPTSYESAKEWAKSNILAFRVPGIELPDVNPVWRRESNFKGGRMRGVEIVGGDKNKIPLDIYKGNSETCFYYTHGSHVLSAHNKVFVDRLKYFSEEHDMTFIAVEYRNHLFHPDEEIKSAQYPAGLNDAYAGLKWVHENKKELGCSTIVNVGEGNGGNMCITLSLKTVEEGKKYLDGSFCHSPESENNVFSKQVASATENDAFGTCYYHASHQAMFIDFFTRNAEDRKSHLAFAVEAGAEHMQGMAPMYLTFNELSPFRDVAKEMYRNFLHGGVDVEARMVMGALHSADFFANTVHGENTLNELKRFAWRVANPTSMIQTTWIELGEKKMCDMYNGERYLEIGSGKVADLNACKESCAASQTGCKTVTYFRSRWCSHFSTDCDTIVKSSHAVQTLRMAN